MSLFYGQAGARPATGGIAGGQCQAQGPVHLVVDDEDSQCQDGKDEHHEDLDGVDAHQVEAVGEQAGEVTCETPYPCPFDRGLIRGVAQQYAPVGSFVFIEETGETCRRNGDDTCAYTVYW